MSELQKSPNWDTHKDTAQFVKDGYPFRESWPVCGPGDGKLFEIVTRNAERHTTYVDFSRQYSSEGLQWRTLSGTCIYRYVVVTWKEKE